MAPKGGSEEVSNLVLACEDCNRIKMRRTVGEWFIAELLLTYCGGDPVKIVTPLRRTKKQRRLWVQVVRGGVVRRVLEASL